MKLLIFPHQLFANHPGLELNPTTVVLIEDSLFFGDRHHPAKMHKQKLWLHRATMKRFESRLIEQGFETEYVEYDPNEDVLGNALREPSNSSEKTQIVAADPVDFLIEKRLRRGAEKHNLDLQLLPSPGFLNSKEENAAYRSDKTRWFMADFYKWQRVRLDVLMEDAQPTGGKWSFDQENRSKVPKKLLDAIPQSLQLERDAIDEEARRYVLERFADNPGTIDQLFYPTSHADAFDWLDHFFEHRFERFGDFEDAIVQGESWLWHSVLTPALNVGLLTPRQVLDATLRFVDRNSLSLNSVEGFIRQLIGWREFMRATYEDLGVTMRTSNHWQHTRPMPQSFYDATTGILPVDDTIRRIQKTGYCHHIERLMVLGGLMFLCEIHPKEIYRWFMEMFVDSYDWVMVTNAFAMSQNADGGLITTKPYFSGSAYVRKMSHYKTGPWCESWDGLYWRWIWNHCSELGRNPRWAMMCRMAEKMDTAKRESHIRAAETFLANLK